MPSFTALTALTLLATTAFAAPTPTDEGVSVTQVAAGQVLKNGPAQVAKTFAKFHRSAPGNILKAAQPVQSGSVTATPEQYDEEYLCPVTVGGTTLNLDFDTGSSDLWVFSTLLPSSERKGHSLYKPSSGNKTSDNWSISYGDLSGASGVVYSDKVTIGGVTATSQAVEAATSVSSSFTADTQNDGLVGLGFPSINSCYPNKCTPFVQTVIKSLKKGQHLFTAALKYQAPGTYTFGYIDSSAYKGEINYVKAKKGQGYWGLNTQGFTVGGGDVVDHGFSAIADTGTTLVYLPDGILSKYYAQVPKSKNSINDGGYVFPCSEASSLPDFGISIGGTVYNIPGEYLNYAPVTTDNGTCFGSLQSSDGLGINILGDVFLKSVFAVFDVGKQRIGFAEQA